MASWTKPNSTNCWTSCRHRGTGMERFLTKHHGTPDLWTLELYRSLGGYQAMEQALRERQPDEIISIVRDAGLRGRGGAGFPTGVKWGFLPPHEDKPDCPVIHVDEGEAGTAEEIPPMI